MERNGHGYLNFTAAVHLKMSHITQTVHFTLAFQRNKDHRFLMNKINLFTNEGKAALFQYQIALLDTMPTPVAPGL